MLRNVWNTILLFIQQNPIFIGLLGTIVGFFFRQIAGGIKWLAKWAWMHMQGRGKDQSFEQLYLTG